MFFGHNKDISTDNELNSAANLYGLIFYKNCFHFRLLIFDQVSG